MPASGYGTCCRKSANGPAFVESAKAYLAKGDRLIDTAQVCDNHQALASALARAARAGYPDAVETSSGVRSRTAWLDTQDPDPQPDAWQPRRPFLVFTSAATAPT